MRHHAHSRQCLRRCEVLNNNTMAIARQRIVMPPRAWRQAAGCLAQSTLWNGTDVARLEQAFARFLEVPHAIAVASGRAGLRIIFDSLQLEPGSEIICSAYGYPIVPFLVQALGFTLKFVDCELQTLGMDPEALAKGISKNTRAVVATHLFGVPCQIRQIADISTEAGASLVEDCAHCFGAAAGSRKVGAFGRVSYFSFETSKLINTLGGGMIASTDHDLAKRMRTLSAGESPRNMGWLIKRLLRTRFEAAVTHPLLFNAAVYPALRLVPRSKGETDRFASGYHGDEVSMKGRMGRFTNYQARLGLAQIERIAPSLQRRTANAQRLIRLLKDQVTFQEPAHPEDQANYMLVTARFPNLPAMVDRLLRLGIDTKHHYMRDCSAMFDTGSSFPNAAQAEREVLHLPAYPQLRDRQIDQIASRVLQAVTP